MDKKDFINKVLSLIEKSLEPALENNGSSSCKRYSYHDYTFYLSGTMAAEDIQLFEEHIVACQACQRDIIQRHKEILREKDRAENELLLKQTMQLLDAFNNEPSNVFDILIKATKDLLEVVKTSGDILLPQIAPIIRGSKDNEGAVQTVQVVQDFPQPPISIQVSCQRNKIKNLSELKISVLHKHFDAFMPDVEVTLTGHGEEIKKTTDDKGEAAFTVTDTGNYQAMLAVENEQIAQVTVTFI